LDNVTRMHIGFILLLLGFAMGFLARTVGNYIWEWMHGLCPVAYDPLLFVGVLCAGSFVGAWLVILLGGEE
jgi:hypothetical protein